MCAFMLGESQSEFPMRDSCSHAHANKSLDKCIIGENINLSMNNGRGHQITDNQSKTQEQQEFNCDRVQSPHSVRKSNHQTAKSSPCL